MASPDLRRLWKLHQIDVAIQEIRNRAAHLDVGKHLAVELNALNDQLANSESKRLRTEQQDLELTQKSVSDKIAKFESELYGGKIVNPREVEAYEKELGILRKQRVELDDRILAIMEALPSHQAAADKLDAAIAEKKKQLLDLQRKAMATKTQLEADFKTKTAQRPEVAKDQNPAILAKYEQIRKNHNGIGMAEVVHKKQCGACGTMLPVRTLQACLDDKTVTCETCHRILYFTEGVV